MSGYTSNPVMDKWMDKWEVFRVLAARGIAKVEVGFSGGNDEGGADYIRATKADDTLVPLDTARAYRPMLYNRVTNQWESQKWMMGYGDRAVPATPEVIAESQLAEGLEGPIYERWGSFAGEFHVNGTLVWDVVAKTAVISGQENVETYDDFEQVL